MWRAEVRRNVRRGIDKEKSRWKEGKLDEMINTRLVVNEKIQQYLSSTPIVLLCPL